MPHPDAPPDPFAGPRDPDAARADAVVREYWLRHSSPALLFRQGAGACSYAVVVPQAHGERLLTIPMLREADFTFHGDAGSTTEQLADFIVDALTRAEADHLRLPLLSPVQGEHLTRALRSRLPAWRFASALAAVAPVARRRPPGAEPGILRKALARARRDGLVVERVDRLPDDEIRALHRARWGDNRDAAFFGMLRTLLDDGCAELFTARTADGRLVAAQVDILGTTTRHYYYTASDRALASGAGTAVLAASWERFSASDTQAIYSFGRGSERYKYAFATDCVDLFELRGFLGPEKRDHGGG